MVEVVEEEEVEEAPDDEGQTADVVKNVVVAAWGCAGLMAYAGEPVAVDRLANEIFDRSLNVNCWLSGRTRANCNRDKCK